MPNISKKLIYDKGLKGNGVARINGKTTKAYTTWKHMLERCYCPKYLSRNQTYVGCYVCDGWLYFPNFKKWFDKNYVEGFQLDKDLLVAGNKTYSSETCVFVPPSINTLFNDCGKSRGDYPIGVVFDKQHGKFKANISINSTRKHLGLFDSVEDASKAYLMAKKENIIRMANEWKEKIPSKLFDTLLAKADNI